MIVHSPWTPACRDCGASTGSPCDESCGSAAAVEVEAIAADLVDVDEPCCPSPSYAAATLCGCGGARQAVAA